jgi:hypothetical protein
MKHTCPKETLRLCRSSPLTDGAIELATLGILAVGGLSPLTLGPRGEVVVSTSFWDFLRDREALRRNDIVVVLVRGADRGQRKSFVSSKRYLVSHFLREDCCMMISPAYKGLPPEYR